MEKTNADFQRSNSASARALAGDGTLSIDNIDATVAAQLGLELPSDTTTTLHTDKTIARGMGDAIALVAANHNAEIQQALQPRGKVSSVLFNEMERARCEARCVDKYSGVACNLDYLWQKSHANTQTTNSTEQLKLIFGTLTREILGLKVSPNSRLQEVISVWRTGTLKDSADLWSQLRQAVGDQREFALTSLQVIKSLQINAPGNVDADDLSIEAGQPDEESAQQSADNADDDSQDSTESDEEPDTDMTITVELREDTDQPTESLIAQADDTQSEEAIMANRDAPVSADSENAADGSQLAGSGYVVYSSAEDEIVSARNMCTADELAELRVALDLQIHRHAKVVGRLSGRLQRVLMAQQQRHWKFDLEEGILDSTRLTRVVTEPLSALSFKTESDIEFKNTTVTLLVDNSKSMLGKPIAIAAACSDLLSQTLERCGVTVEILGFTTTQLHGGDLFDQWKNNGAASNPGRLNGLRHIIYKAADTPYRSARKNFGVMLLKDLLKQNVDGEALLWAHDRLLRRPEQRKILMVISDGAPIDTSTMTANSKNYLSDHLHQVIHSIEKHGAVELLAIGIGHDVSQYYRRAMKIMDARDLSKSMLAHLSALFSQAN